jgi:hypothetical protein
LVVKERLLAVESRMQSQKPLLAFQPELSMRRLSVFVSWSALSLVGG